MTARTRRRLTVCFVLALLTLPAEAMLFPVALTPDARVAAAEWATTLSPNALKSAAARIEAYPALYRRAIMSELTPADRSSVWQSHFGQYRAAHPELTAEQVAVLQDAIAVAQPGLFGPGVNDEMRARVGKIYGRAIKAFGPRVAGELFVSLGPKKVESAANALPLRQRIGDQIRSWRTVNADVPECNCNVEIDTCDPVPHPELQCSEQFTCDFDMDWPMCGPLWCWACTGWCRLLILGGGESNNQ